MGSSAFKASELPAERQERVDQAIEQDMKIIVGEASGASRLFQDYLKAKATETRAVPLSAYSSVMHPNARFAMAPWF
jgi:hypothetical protein